MAENDKVEEVKVEEMPANLMVQETSPASLMQLALQNNASIDVIERMMALYERWEANQARKAYIKAMSDFQSKCPIIKRKKEGGKTKEGVVAYKYAPIEDLVEQTKELISECGFSYSLNTPLKIEREGVTGVEVVMIISHIAGHSETYTQFMPFVTKTGVMSEPQVLGATQSYAKRYVFQNGFGIMTGEDDTDAVGNDLIESLEAYYKNLPQRVQLFLKSEASKISSKRVFEEWLMKLPTESHVQELQKVLPKIHPSKQDELWITFIKQNTDTVGKFLTNLTQSLTQGATK